MKFKKLIPAAVSLSLVLLAFFLLLPRLPSASGESADQAFERYTQTLFSQQIASNTLTLHYTLADPEALGIHKQMPSLGSYSPEAQNANTAAMENCLTVLDTFPSKKLSEKNRQTCDILKAQLRLELCAAAFPLYEEFLSPTLGIQAQLPILLAEYSFRSRQDVEDYLSLLRQLDSCYESLLLYEREKSAAGLFMSDKTAEAVIAQCQSFIARPAEHFLLTTFDERLEKTDFLSEAERGTFRDSNRAALFGHVFPAYELLIQGLSDLKGSGTNVLGLCHFPQGRDYYAALTACLTGSGRTVEEMTALIETKMLEDVRTMADTVAAHPELLKAPASRSGSSDPLLLLRTLESESQRDFPKIQSAPCQVKYVDASLAEYLSPAFYLTPPLDLMEEHVIYINPAGNYDSLSLFTTLAHEGYPGHLYQTAAENAQNLNPVRSLFYFGGYTEGWATYAERCSYQYASLEPQLARLLSANADLSLGIYARADIGLHYDGWTSAKLRSYLRDYGITDTGTIEAMEQAILADPANYLKYYLGAAEFEALRAETQAALGSAFSLRDFHGFLLAFGPAPFPVLRAYLNTWTEGRR